MANQEFNARKGAKLQGIVLPTDFSPNSRAAIPYALELAKGQDREILLVHVGEDPEVHPMIEPGGEAAMNWPRWVEASHKEHQAQLTRLAAELSTMAPVPVRTFLIAGNAPKEIAKFAREHDAYCIVITTHGRTGVSHFLLGSVAERVVQLAPCPVLTVKMTKDAPPPPKAANHVDEAII